MNQVKGWNIELSTSQFDYLCEVLMDANDDNKIIGRGWDIQEDYQMPAGYWCLCEDCFMQLPIIEKFEYGTNKLNPKWNDEKMGWFMPLE